MKRALILNVRPPAENQLILTLPVYRVANGSVEFDLNQNDIPEIIKVLQKNYDDMKQDEDARKVKV